MPFVITANIVVQRDTHGRVGQLTHLTEPYRADERGLRDSRALAAAYLRDVQEIYGIDRQWIDTIGDEPTASPQPTGTQLRFGEEKRLLDSTTVSYAQTHRGVPVWESGFSIHMLDKPLRVTSSASTLHEKIEVKDADDTSPFSPEQMNESLLVKALRLSLANARGLKINSRRWRIYRYVDLERIHREIKQSKGRARGKSSPPPSLPLPPVANIRDGEHFLVTEVMFTLPLAKW